MNAIAQPHGLTESTPLNRAADQACALIAPTWPLDRFIAVNPWWSMIDQRPEHCHALLAARGGARAVMDRSYFLQQWRQGTISAAHLQQALEESGHTQADVDTLVAHLNHPGPSQRMQLVTDLLDIDRERLHQMAWGEEVIHQISQFCAAEFDQGQTEWHPQPGPDLYATWRQRTAGDRGMAILMGARGLHRHFAKLPDNPDTLIAQAVTGLGIEETQLTAYFHALLLSINGWASWCAYRNWQAKLKESTDPSLRDLLAIRLAWEWVLFEQVTDLQVRARWQQEMQHWDDLAASHRTQHQWDWVWQRALELAYQSPLIGQLSQPPATSIERPQVQAVFCIDVRSEVIRRALEAANPRIQTAGFAGFFGLPIAYQPLGHDEARPQLPGLLAPAMTATDAPTQHAPHGIEFLRERQQKRLAGNEMSRQFRWGSASTFSYVEATGLFYIWKLFRDSFLHRPSGARKPAQASPLTPSIETLQTPEGSVSLVQQVDLAEGILRNLSLTHDFAPLVLLTGHGSACTNNPHQSGLDCGACCGQTGEVNARLVTALLNTPAVREKLAERGIRIPGDTHFIAGLHNTTTDEVTLFDPDQVPQALRSGLAQLRADLQDAQQRALQERAPALGVDSDLQRRIGTRTRDWSQVRPEWGLAGNAAFIAAPRSRTRHLNLQGRAFLHDYQWCDDAGFKVLETIMTAPMIVAHWINLQYYASTVDNRHYGSGNKVLHNVVGGRLGVFEGNGGDLRTGLALQSLHDGEDWVHSPLRLSVFIEAPEEAIRDVVNRHTSVRHLVDHQWLYLYRLDSGSHSISRLYQDQWIPVSAS